MVASLMQDRLAWLLSGDLGREKLALLVLCMIAIYVVTAHLSWRLVHVGTGRGFVLAVGQSWVGRGTVQVLRLLYHVGIPFAVLWQGALLSQMGIPTTYAGGREVHAALHLFSLVERRDIMHLGSGVAVGIAALCLLIGMWVWYARVFPGFGKGVGAVPLWRALREALYLQMLWTLYRGFAATLASDRVLAGFVSLVLITLPWLLSPRWRHDLFTPRSSIVVRDWLCALFTVFASLAIHSVWLLVLMHTLWVWVSGRIWASFSPSQ